MARSYRSSVLLVLLAGVTLAVALETGAKKAEVAASVNNAGDVVIASEGNSLDPTVTTEESPSPRKLKQSAGPPRGSGFWSVAGQEFLDANGRVVKFAGVQWGGIETDGAPHGLWTRNYNDMLAQMKSLGFNMIRLSFSGASLNPFVYPFGIGINYQLNPDLQGLNCISVMDKIVNACGTHGLKVILDYHRVNFTAANEGGLWWDIYSPETVWVNNWAKLATRYKGLTQVLGADLFNEPHQSEAIASNLPIWGLDGQFEPYNFRTACMRAASAIQAVNKDWIIFISGLWQGTWWGGNLVQVGVTPLGPLPVSGKLAYSSHDYGPYVYWQSYFNATDFPDNMPAIWDKNWGYLFKQNKFPLWVGEWGGFFGASGSEMDSVEDTWLLKLTDYIHENQLSHTWFNWGPDSKDTGGILLDDWKSVDTKKLNLLKKILHPNFGPSLGQTFKQQRLNVYRHKHSRLTRYITGVLHIDVP